MKFNINRFLILAFRWQEYHQRDPASAVKKLKEEIEEYEEAEGYLEQLDELGDVLVLAMRIVTGLSEEEQEFVYRVAKMKADRRLVDPGIKDKAAEALEIEKLAEELKLK